MHTQELPSDGAPVHAPGPAQSTVASGVPAREIPAQELPAQEAPAQELPGQAAEPAPVSQRERNRRETWMAIHTAAHAIASQDGPEGATVEQIATAAGVSRRTFFNYFPTKEDAILGTQLPQMTAEIAERFHASTRDELNRVVHLFAAVVRTSMPAATIDARRVIVKAHPELRSRLMHLLGHVEELVSELVTHEESEGDAALRPALMMLAGTITKYAFSQYAKSHVDDFEAQLEDAIATFRTVLEATR